MTATTVEHVNADQVNVAADLEALLVPVADIDRLPGNPRRGDVDAVARSYATFGQRKPIVVRRMPDGRGQVVAGNHQLDAAHQLGWDRIAVVWTDDDDATAEAFALADNRTAELGDYDNELLLAMVDRVGEADAELLVAAAFGPDDVDALRRLVAAGRPRVALTDPDAVPDPPAVPVTQVGDVWVLGPHRLICGDSTDPEIVDRLMAGGRASLAATDPPYNVGLDYNEHSDDYSDEEHQAFAIAWFANLCAHSDRQIVTPGCNNLASWCRWFDPYHVAPWTKANAMTSGKVSRFWCWEPILFFGEHWKIDGQRANDLFNFPIGQQKGVGDHPCPKPVSMWADLISSYSKPAEIVLDLFGGSGTTLIACYHEDRIARLVELDPGYCDVIVKRWEEHTGGTAVREDDDGRS